MKVLLSSYFVPGWNAKELLGTTNNKLQMIAEAVGYTEGNNFQAILSEWSALRRGVEEEKLTLIIKSL